MLSADLFFPVRNNSILFLIKTELTELFFWLSFFSIWVWIGCGAVVVASVAHAARVYAEVTRPDLYAAFAVYQHKISLESLTFVCLATYKRDELRWKMKNESNKEELECAFSPHNMKKDEVAVVEMDVPIRTTMKEILLRCIRAKLLFIFFIYEYMLFFV